MQPRFIALASFLAVAAAVAPQAQAAKHPRKAPAPAAVSAEPAIKPVATIASGPFDARDPASLIVVLGGLDAKAQIATHDKDSVVLAATSPAGDFKIQFGGCDGQGHACAALQFEAAADAKTATLGELNSFNQSSLVCRLYQDKAGKPHVLYSALVFASTTRQDMLTHVGAWRGCLADFSDFLKDPPGYLATAP